jgi:endoglucanase
MSLVTSLPNRLLALVTIAASSLVVASTATAQPVPDMPAPQLGPAPDVQPVPGQDRTPPVLRDCKHAGVPQAYNGADPRGADPRSPNPLANTRFFVDPTEPAFKSYSHYVHKGQRGKASLMWKIAGQPRFRWFGKFTRPRFTKKVHDYLNCVAAVQPGTVPLMTILRHQGKACNPHYTGGGRAEDARTRKWYRKFAGAIGNARVVIAFEPDSLGTVDCLAKSRRKARLKMLRYGVDQLAKLPNGTVYIEAGASDWEPARRTAKMLRYVGVRKVRGFMLNVTHYDWTGNNIAHGLKISRLTGGKHFIINTGENGRGPVHFRHWISHSRHSWRTINVWCHPLKRGLGPSPTTATARSDKVDAYMWIGRPGYSSGSCNGGPLPVGSWWADRGLMFASYATNWLRPPAGTSNGHYRHYSLSQLGG